MPAKTHYNIKLIRAPVLASAVSEISPEIIQAAPETAPAARLDSGQIEPETLPRRPAWTLARSNRRRCPDGAGALALLYTL